MLDNVALTVAVNTQRLGGSLPARFPQRPSLPSDFLLW